MQERNMPPFAPVLMQSTRAIGYSLEAAIADIIDNSIAAKAGKVQLSFFPGCSVLRHSNREKISTL